MYQVTSGRYGEPLEPPLLPDRWKLCDPGWEREHVEFHAETVTAYWVIELREDKL